MTREEVQELIKSSKQSHKKLSWVRSGYVHSPFISKYATLNKHEYNASYYSVYALVANPSIHYVTVLGFYDGKYILKCGDAYLEGAITKDTIETLLNKVVEKSRGTNKNLLNSLESSFNIVPRSSACTFNQKNWEICNKPCDHISTFLHDLPEVVLDELYNNYYQGLHDSKNDIAPDLNIKFDRYAFKKHILLEGDKGSGKTYAATRWGKDKEITQLFIGGHEQFESIDFLGHYIQQKSGNLIWKDGPLSEAFRKAKRGEKVVLIIDEILRIPKRELNLLISALSPIDKKYVLRTGRATSTKDDIAVEEVIHTPTENLWVIGTTNIGADYAVEAMDEALIDRFKPVRKDTTTAELQQILMQAVKKRNFSSIHVNKLMNFYTKMMQLKKTQILKKIVNIRHLCEAVELAEKQTHIRDIIEDSKLLWVERDYDGYPNAEQLAAIDLVIGKVYA